MGIIHYIGTRTEIALLQPAMRGCRVSVRPLAFLVLLLAASFAFCLHISHYPNFLNIQMNADSLLAVSFIWDLRQHDHALFAFQLPRIPSIFPDLMIQAAAEAISPTHGWSLFVYAWVQMLLFVLTAGWIAALITARPYNQAVAVSAVLIALVILVDSKLPGGTGTTFNYFLSCIHFGPFLGALLASAVACKLLREWRHTWAVLFFVLATLALLSNKLLLAAFAIPVALAAVLVAGGTSKAYRIVALIAAGALVAYLLDSQINRQPNIPIEWTQGAARLRLFLVDSLAYVRDHLWVVILCVFFPMAVFSGYLLSLAGSMRAFLSEGPRSEAAFAKAFFCLVAGGAISAVFGAVALLAYIDHGSYRYLTPVLTWPILFTIGAVLSRSVARKSAYALGIGIVAVCAGDVLRRGDITPGAVSWRSPVAECILASKDRFQLQAGIAEYWTSRPVMFGSNWTLQVNQATGDGRPRIWGNNPYWYTKAFGMPNGVPTYNFVVMERMDPLGVRKRFGEPTERIRCPSGQEIWVYEDGKRMTERFLEPLAPPNSSYEGKCSDVIRIGSRLSGRCQQADGTWKWTRFRYKRVGSR